MYKIYENDEAIKEVQTYLHFFSDRSGDIPKVAIDGVYGEETANAVKAFQESGGIPARGVVDYNTFDALYSAYYKSETESAMRGYILSSGGFPIKYGDHGSDVAVINSLLNELRITYSEIELDNNASYFSRSTENSIRYMQSVFLLEESGMVDEATFNRLILEIDAERAIGRIYD